MSSSGFTGLGTKTASSPDARPRRSRHGVKRALVPWAFLLAPLALLGLFTFAPVTSMFWYSLTQWEGLGPADQFVGLDNYREIFTRSEYLQVFLVSLYYAAASVVQIALALYFATVLSFNTRFRNFFKGVIFFPHLINGVAIGFVFLYLFQPGGTLDSVLAMFGIQDPPHWLGDPAIVNWSLAGTAVWRHLGLNFVLFLGAIQSIPTELYEAAALDRANRWHQFIYIILPGIRRVVALSVILAASGALSAFETPFIMTGGANGSRTFVIAATETAFSFRKFGLASALAVVLLAAVVLVSVIQRRVLSDDKVDLA